MINLNNMNKLRSLSMAALVGLCGIAGAQAQDTLSKINNLPEFSGIDVTGALSVVLSQGDQNTIKIERADKDDATEYKVVNNQLQIKGKGFSHSKTKIYITARMVNEVSLHGATSFNGENKFVGEIMKIESTGASDIQMQLEMNKIEVRASGASDVELTGSAKSALLEASGSSDIKAIDCVIDSATVIVSGASDAKVNAKKYLSINASGASDVTYLGTPERLEKVLSGASGIKGNADTARINILGKQKLIIIGDDEDFDVDVEDDKDSTNHKKKDKFEINWAGIGIGANGYLNKDYNTNLPKGYDFLELNSAKSVAVTVNFFETNLPIVKNHINLVTGLGLEFNNYRFENDYTLWSDSSRVGASFDSTRSFSKNKLMVSYLQAPLLLQFNTNPLNKKGTKSLHLSLGVVGGWRIGTHTKQILDKGDNSNKVKDDFNLSAFKYGPMVRVGYGKLDLWATYSVNNMFKNNKAPQLNQFSVGVTLLGL